MSRVVDLSFRSCVDTQELSGKVKRTSTTPAVSGCLRINNNKLSTVNGLSDLVNAALGKGSSLSWLDVSFNHLTEISLSSLPDLNKLKVLYLHGNKLKDLHATLQVLKEIPSLLSLTLNGNPFQSSPDYRMVVLGALPNLRSFDHAAVTIDERERAKMWFKFSSNIH